MCKTTQLGSMQNLTNPNFLNNKYIKRYLLGGKLQDFLRRPTHCEQTVTAQRCRDLKRWRPVLLPANLRYWKQSHMQRTWKHISTRYYLEDSPLQWPKKEDKRCKDLRRWRPVLLPAYFQPHTVLGAANRVHCKRCRQYIGTHATVFWPQSLWQKQDKRCRDLKRWRPVVTPASRSLT